MSDTNSGHMKLMREMGAASFDPIPPDQYLVFLEDPGMELTQRGQRGLAWLRSKTIHPDAGHRRWAWGHDQRGDLRLKHMADDLEWDLPAASKIWSELVAKGFARRDDKGRLWLCGKVERQENAASSDEPEVICTDNLPQGLSLFFQSLPESERENRRRRVEVALKFGEQLKADAMAAARATHEQIMEQVYHEIGYDDEETRGRKRTHRELIAKLDLAMSFDQYFVQITTRDLCTNGSPIPHTNGNGSVHNCHPLSPSEQRHSEVEPPPVENFVSEGKKVAANPAPQSTHASAPPNTAPLKTPVQEQMELERHPLDDPNPVIHFVQHHFGRRLARNDELQIQFAELAQKYKIPAASVVRFLAEKTQKKGGIGYRISTPGALYTWALTDLPAWILKHTREIHSDASWERSEHPGVEDMPLADRIRTSEEFLREFPNHKDAPSTRKHLEQMRAQQNNETFDPTGYNAEMRELAAKKGMP